MHLSTLIVGVGSPHGDDRAGWLVADALSDMAGNRVSKQTTSPSMRHGTIAIRKICVPADLFDWLDDAAHLIICDAVRGGEPTGTLYRWLWPDARITQWHPSGSHDLGLGDVLNLACQLGRLPAEVVVWGIEAGQTVPEVEVSRDVQRALPDLVTRIWKELDHA